MCITSRKPSPAPQIIAAGNSAEASQNADIEARLRRLRAGAAANVLTSARGIPSGATSQLGVPA